MSPPPQKIKVTVSSSVDNWGWFPYCAVDGQCSSTPASMGWSSYDSLTVNHSAWIQLDLGTAQAVNRVDLYPRDDGGNAGTGFPVDFTIKTSTDATNWTTVITQTNYPKPAGTVQSFAFSSVNARYVKITGTRFRPNPGDNNYYYMQFAEIETAP